MEPNVEFEHLAASSQFAQFTRLLEKLTGLAMALNSPEGVIRGISCTSEGSPLCRLIRGNAEGSRRCTQCDQRHHTQAARNSQSLLYTCHAGFFDLAVPIFASDKHVATISSGQVLTQPHSEAGFQQFVKTISWMDYPQADLKLAYFQSPFLPRDKIGYVMELLELFAVQLCDSLQTIKELEARLEREEIRRAKDYIARHYHDSSWGLEHVARHVGLSTAHFSHLFKQVTGVSFVHFVQTTRIQEAKKLMNSTSKTITEIGFACGFNSVTNFNRVFRQVERRSPRESRNSAIRW